MTKQFTKCITLLMLTVLFAGDLSAQLYQVGYSSMTFTDPSRGNRQIPAEIFYPADVTGNNVPLGSPFDKKYPVVIFGHDEATPYYNYQYAWDRWVPQGFIVVTPLSEMTAPMNVDEFAKDMAFVAEQFKLMRYNPTSFYFKRLNQKACFIGHGLGASAAVQAVQYHPNVTTLITLAANEATPSTIAAASQVTVPSVVVVGGNDCISPLGTVQEAIFNNLASDCKTLMNFTTESRCVFAQNDGACVALDNPCAATITYPYQLINLESTWMLVSFMRFYMKSNAPALDKFEWKLKSKKKDFLYIMSCAEMAPRLAWQPEDSEGEENFESLEALDVNMYPNPVISGSDLKLDLTSPFETKVTIMITDLMGKLVSNQEVNLNENRNELSLSTIGISKGAYLLTVTGIEGRKTKPLIIN